ncbi:unnamed protein product [Brassicogethes aeneus]|uniref:Uncharacterized protein n=1 Tax=Brassicogethes aeneus TaxID=1431903 RepID=A0A9P0BIA7_BRAAE|nr:unnamed protein product [Brassicogethes aeneus]
MELNYDQSDPNHIDLSEADLLIEDTIKKRERVVQMEGQQNQMFRIHLNTVQNYFLRLSTIKKTKFLSELIGEVNDSVTLTTLLSVVYTVDDKLASYLKVTTDTNNIHDKLLADHNRSVEKSAIEMTLSDDTVWFQHLSNFEQYKLILYCCFERLQRNLEQIEDVKVSKQRQNNEIENESYKKDDPFNIKVEQSRNDWNKMIMAYAKKIEIEHAKLSKQKDKNKDKKVKKGNDKKSKKGKSSKSSKLSKSSKTSKSSKKNPEFVVKKDLEIESLLQKSKFSKVLGVREQKLMKRGAIIRKLRPKFQSAAELFESSLFNNSVKPGMSTADLPYDFLTSYPRIHNEDTLYKNKPCREIFEMEIEQQGDIGVDVLFELPPTSVTKAGLNLEKTAMVEDW